MILAAHQPHYLPWLGYLDKIRRADKFLIVDHVQFERRNFQNRTRIPAAATPEGWRWLTVPVVQNSREERILDKMLADDPHWRRKHVLALEQIYHRAPHYRLYAPALRSILESKWDRLVDLNIALLKFFLEAFEIRTPLSFTSEMGPIPGQKSEFVLNMCRMAGATVYLSGEGACRRYLDEAVFRAAGVEIQWQGFKHPEYARGPGEGPLPGITALDLLFHCGPGSGEVLAGKRAVAASPAGAVALIAGARGAAGEDLALELASGGRRVAVLGRDARPDAVDFLFYLDHPGGDGAGAAAIVAAAEAAEKAGGLKHVCLLGADRPNARARVVEDALRYLAGQRGASMSVLRAGPEAFTDRTAGRRLASLAVSSALSGISGVVPPPSGREPVVLVTGASGSIGRAMGRLLQERGIARRGTDIAAAPGELFPDFKRCDLADPAAAESLADFCGPVTHVIHLASRVANAKSLAESYGEQYALNVVGTLNLLKALPPAVRHFAYASSMTVYGNAAAAAVDESHPVEPNCVYALTKLAAERLLLEEGALKGLRVALLRYTGAYGPGSVPGRAIPNMILRLLDGRAPEIYGQGTARRDYIYVDDLCRATLAASLREAEGIFNVGTGVGVSAAELAGLLIRLTGAAVTPEASPRAVDAQAASSMVYDIGKMRRELGFTPEITLEEGLRRTIRHFQEAR